MSLEIFALILFVAILVVLFLGYPVAFALGGVSIWVGSMVMGIKFFDLLPLRIYGNMQNIVLLAVPLFIFMGLMLEKSGIAERMLQTLTLLMGRLRGGLALAVIIVGILLAASTGIVGATVVTMGLLSLPTMLKRQYSKRLATGVIVSAGTLGQIIPPSIVLILLGSVMNVPVGDMFMGAVIPGLLLSLGYVVYVLVYARLHPQQAPAASKEELAAFRSGSMTKDILLSFLLPFLLILAVLGSIFAGIATPTEAAGIGALAASLMTAAQGKLSMKVLKEVMSETTFLTSMVFMILVGAAAFSLTFRALQGERLIIEAITQSELSPAAFFWLTMLGIFIAGFFIDFIEITFIFVPILTPLFQKFGFDLLWVGILIAMNLQSSFLTPPFGFSLFYLKGVAPKEVRTSDIYRGVVPFLLVQVVVLLLIYLFPGLVLWLPDVLNK
ncbi:MAG: C4-dicarboxylate ABC transporter [Thermonema sp.]|uniref:TRAP transporter large permease n=1 Tax=Thermonema TaxID=28194 RepID=UPI00057100B4|nr:MULTISPECIES: TRAP transporter large permease subunit [Thermonema]GIV38289.1 MAG: C4-dicarboxylate ABC transporter [Thermonema sp.]